MAIEADKVRLYPDPFALIRDFKPGNESLVMAARVSGPVKSAFPGKPEGDTEGPDYIAETKEPASIVLVADTDLLDDRSWLASQSMFGQQMQIPLADNANFVANALDYLVGSEALLDLRGREVTSRPFTQGGRDPARGRAAVPGQGAGAPGQAGRPAAEAQCRQVSEGDDQALVSDEQKQEIEGFRSQLLETRRELREVQLALRKDIEDLRGGRGSSTSPPCRSLVAVLAIVMALVQRARYRRRFDAVAHA